MGEKLVLDDADSSAYVVFGSLLGPWGSGCARIGCGEHGVDLACLASHPRRHMASFITSHYLLHKMVTKHTQFVKSIQATFHSCSQDTYVAAKATSCTLWVAETAKLRLDWS